jgi:hypothetical protein
MSMNWRAFFSGMLGGLLIVASLTLPQMRAQTPWGAYPLGGLFMTTYSACPAGTAEISAFNGAMPLGTIAANGDVGATGGSNTVTPGGSNATANFTPTGNIAAPVFSGSAGIVPAETVSWPAGVPTFAGSSGTVPAQTFTGTPFSSVINHTHTVTVTYNVQGGTTAATTGTHVMTSTATGGSARAPTAGDAVSATTANPSGGVSSITPAGTNGTASFTPAGTVAWPAGVPTNGTASFTPVGTNSAPAFTGTQGTVPGEAWTGTQFDNRSAFVKVIFCQKT